MDGYTHGRHASEFSDHGKQRAARSEAAGHVKKQVNRIGVLAR